MNGAGKVTAEGELLGDDSRQMCSANMLRSGGFRVCEKGRS